MEVELVAFKEKPVTPSDTVKKIKKIAVASYKKLGEKKTHIANYYYYWRYVWTR